jgi:hypothetical protein
MSGPDIFVSYAHGDQERIVPIVAALEARGWSVFWDRRIPAGQTWRSHIGRALDQARCVVVAWSEHAIHSDWVMEEAERGKRRHILVPVLLDLVDPPFGFGGIQAADLTGWSPERPSPAFDSFLADLGAVLGAPQPGPTTPQPGPTTPRPWWSRVGPKPKAGRRWLGIVLVVGAISAAGGYAYFGLRSPPEPAPTNPEAAHRSEEVVGARPPPEPATPTPDVAAAQTGSDTMGKAAGARPLAEPAPVNPKTANALLSNPYGSSPPDPAKTRVLDLRGEVLEVKGGVLAVTSPSAEVGRGRVLDLRGGQLTVEGPTSGLERRILPY